MKKLPLLLFFFSTFFYAQEYKTDDYTISVEAGNLTLLTGEGRVFYSKTFNSPSVNFTDLDDDGVEELFIIDSTSNSNSTFIIYIYNTIDSFALADSIISGVVNPYIATSDEIEGLIIVTGNYGFNEFNEGEVEKFLPLDVWRYDSGELFNLNEEVYDIFLAENEYIINFLEGSAAKGDCSKAKEVIAAIAAAYENYLSAGEDSLAYHFLNKFYDCSDREQLKAKLENKHRKEN
jgi:hypothetical protein